MIKSTHVMETLPNITAIAFDKTGTLTNGNFTLNKVDIIDKNYNEKSVLAIASALESYSAHPIAKAFICYRNYQDTIDEVKVAPSAGVSGKVNQQDYQIGKAQWLLPKTQVDAYKNSQCVLMSNNRLIAAFYLTDDIRPDAKELLSNLQQEKINTLLLSGDNQAGCKKVTAQLQINQCHHSLTPADKVEIIKQQKNDTVAMVGDGVNDTPVFGAAHISIAMGSGTDIAKNGADVILLSNQLASISILKKVAHKTRAIIWQNYLWAFGYNAIILPLAVCGLVTPYMAVIGMSSSSILVVTNSLRLLKK